MPFFSPDPAHHETTLADRVGLVACFLCAAAMGISVEIMVLAFLLGVK